MPYLQTIRINYAIKPVAWFLSLPSLLSFLGPVLPTDLMRTFRNQGESPVGWRTQYAPLASRSQAYRDRSCFQKWRQLVGIQPQIQHGPPAACRLAPLDVGT